MKKKSKWAILVAGVIIVSLAVISYPVTACFSQTTSCEGQSVYQGDGGATNYWYDDLYPSEHIVDPGASTDWTITVKGGGGCSGYEHCTVTDNAPPTSWSTTLLMGTIRTGSFHYIDDNSPVNEGDNIEDREFYIGNSWDYDVTYRITSPPSAPGGAAADMKCTVYVVGKSPENQHDYVYVHCNATINAVGQPDVSMLYPNGGEILTGTEMVIWEARDPNGDPLSFEILLSSDSGETYPDTIATLGDVRSYAWDTTSYPDDNHYRLKIVAFDGTNYGRDYTNNDFALDNHVPDPPSNLIIQFGLTTNAQPIAKAPDDTTGSDLERIQKDDIRGYVVMRNKMLSMEIFDTSTQNEPVESATLYVKYWVENLGYSGNQEVMWKLETDATFKTTGIKPVNTEMEPVIKSFDLYANGVDTLDKITNLDIQFYNNDLGLGENVSFDYIWVTFKASSDDIGLTWLPSPSPDINHYHIYRSPDNSAYTKVGESTFTHWNDPGAAVDLNNYFYRVRGVDHGDKESVDTYTVCKYVINLSSAWNMVSTPLIQQADDSVGTVLQSIDGIYEAVQTYHAGDSRPWLHWQFSKPSALNSLTNMDNTDGYYIYMQSADHWISLGRLPAGVVIPLKAGWNLIGYPNLNPMLRDTALSSILAEVNVVYGFDPVAGREVKVEAIDLMCPGNAYWIHVRQDCDLLL